MRNAFAIAMLLATAALLPGADRGDPPAPAGNPLPRQDPGNLDGCRFALRLGDAPPAMPPAATGVARSGWVLWFKHGAGILSLPVAGDAVALNEYNMLAGGGLEVHAHFPSPLLPNAQALAPGSHRVSVTVWYHGALSADHQRFTGGVTWVETEGDATTTVEFPAVGAPAAAEPAPGSAPPLSTAAAVK